MKEAKSLRRTRSIYVRDDLHAAFEAEAKKHGYLTVSAACEALWSSMLKDKKLLAKALNQ